MGCLIDTDLLIDLERRRAEPSRLFDFADQPFFIATITASEVFHGVHRASSPTHRERRLAFLEAVLEFVPVIPFDLQVAEAHAELWAGLQAKGMMIGAHDLMIAATAVTHGLTLISRNRREFQRVDRLKLSDWSSQ